MLNHFTIANYLNHHQNESQQTVRDVVLKTDLQTSSQRMPLSNPTGQAMVSKLVPGENISEVRHSWKLYVVSEFGYYVLFFLFLTHFLAYWLLPRSFDM